MQHHEVEQLSNEALYHLAVMVGDPFAQHCFDLRFRKTLTAASMRWVDDISLAEEVSNTVLRRVLTNSNKTQVLAVASFLSRAIRNASLSALEKLATHRKRTAELKANLLRLESVESLPNQSLEIEDDSLRYQHLHEAISSLKSDQCEALQAFYFEQLSYAQIADRMQIPPDTVKSHLQNGRKRIRNYLLKH